MALPALLSLAASAGRLGLRQPLAKELPGQRACTGGLSRDITDKSGADQDHDIKAFGLDIAVVHVCGL
jgi:hypothetical protein